ncbi:MAG: hypothetical protein WB992_12445 [Bryobacteraceae bacterium]
MNETGAYSRRLISAIRHSPLWCSPANVHESSEDSAVEAEGVDLVWYFRTFREQLGPSAGVADCAAHYAIQAGRLFRSPNLAFDEFWYRHEHADVEESVIAGRYRSGWSHYIEEGAKRLYNPTSWFDERWYLKQHSEVSSGVKSGGLICGFEHYLLYGIRQDFSPSIYFNAEWYRRKYLADTNQECLRASILHYVLLPRTARPSPSPLFNQDWYSKQYLSSVQGEQKWTPFDHYMILGRRLGYSPSPYFNESAYRETYSEVSEMLSTGIYRSGLEHYINEGLVNGFIASNHLDYSGVDYAGPDYLRLYEQSLSLNLKQIARSRELIESF